jgi:transcriptional regulator PpsR
MLLKLVQSAPDCLVVTDLEGRVISANMAFIELAQLTTEEQVRGETLDRWLGRTGVDLSVMVSNLRQRGAVRLFATTLRGEYGAITDVEISATMVPHGDHPFLGFTIRDVGRRLNGHDTRATRELPRSVGQLTELVGRVPLKDIVGETTDLIEQLCIEAALELTRDNRASAAEMLGLSRQSLYVKLRRYGLGDLGTSPAEAEK